MFNEKRDVKSDIVYRSHPTTGMADSSSSQLSTPSSHSEDTEFDPESPPSRKRRRPSKTQQAADAKKVAKVSKTSRLSQGTQSVSVSQESHTFTHPDYPDKNEKKNFNKSKARANIADNVTSPRPKTRMRRRTKSSESLTLGSTSITSAEAPADSSTFNVNNNRTLKATISHPILSFDNNHSNSTFNETIDQFWLDVLSESVAWVFMPLQDANNSITGSSTPTSDGFWWPVVVPVDVYLRPLPLEVIVDEPKEIFSYLSNKDCPVFPLTDPKHSNLCSFLNPSNNLCRFTEDNYILSKDDPQSYTQKFPSKKAFQSALSAASARKCEEDGDLPDIGTESVLSIARRMSTTTRDEKPKEIDNKQEEDGDLSTDNEDPGPEDIEIGDSVIAYWPQHKQKRSTASQKEAFRLACINATTRDELPAEMKEAWWPAKVIEYVPPPKRRKRRDVLIPGSYILSSFDSYQRTFDNRYFFASISDPAFRKVFVGEYATLGEIRGKMLVEVLDSLSDKLSAIIQGQYPHDSGRHDRFLSSNSKEKRISLHQDVVHHGTFQTPTIDNVLDWLSLWINSKTIPPRPRGNDSFEELNEVERQNYASEVLLPLILELLLIDMGELEKKVMKNEKINVPLDGDWEHVSIPVDRKDELTGKAHKLAIAELQHGDWISDIVSQHAFLTKDVFKSTSPQETSSKVYYDFAVRPRRKAAVY